MDHVKRRDMNLHYLSDKTVLDEQTDTRKLIHELNTGPPSKSDRIVGDCSGGIAAGSCGGNPCKVIRIITEKDRKYYCKIVNLTKNPGAILKTGIMTKNKI